MFMERDPDLASRGPFHLLRSAELPVSAEAASELHLCRQGEAASGTEVWVKSSGPPHPELSTPAPECGMLSASSPSARDVHWAECST